METAFLWGGIGVLVLFILIGFLAGLIRGLKRSALHIIFFVVSFVIAFFITRPITSAILGISITVDGTPTTLNNIVYSMLDKQFNLGDYQAVGDFAKTLPLSVAAPIAFIIISLVTYLLFDIIYLIVARLAFGKKKKDFATKKPLRWFGSAVGAVEGFLFMFLIFAPLTSLTQTYQSLATYDTDQSSATSIVLAQDETQQSSTLPLLPELVGEYVPSTVDDIIRNFNNSVVGKVSGAGGLNHALFDYLSSSKVNKEKIHFRKDLLALADTYNEFAIAYNQFNAKEYESIDLTALKTSLEKFLNEGIFKGVLAPTVQEVVVNFDENNPPEFIQKYDFLLELVKDLKEEFSAEDFSAKEYLKNDILDIVDIAQYVTEDGFIDQILDANKQGTVKLLELVSNNNEKLKGIVNKVFDLNIMSDGFNALGTFASQKLSDYLENEDIKLNLSISDRDAMLDTAFGALKDLLDINEKVPVADLVDGDILENLSKLDVNLEEILIQAGKTIDKIRGLEILVITEEVPAQQEAQSQEEPAPKPETKTTYVFDEILKNFNISLLGDKIHKNPSDEKTVEVKDYETFFTTIAKPVGIIQRLGVLDIFGEENPKMEDVLISLLDEMKKPKEEESEGAVAQAQEDNHDLLSQLLLPFFELQKATIPTGKDENGKTTTATIREKIFDTLIDELEKMEQLSFAGPKQFEQSKQPSKDDNQEKIDSLAKEVYNNWKAEFDQMGETLLELDKHQIESSTYIRYLMTDGTNFEKLLDTIVKDGTLKDILKSVFKASVFDPLVDQIFDQLDEAVKGLTGVPEQTELPKTSLDNLDGNEDAVADILQTLLDFANDENNKDLNNVDLAKIGEILDALKDNAENGGTKDGVFSAVFENLIWYLTGDDISTDKKYKDVQSEKVFDQRETIKGYLGDQQETVDYYSIDFAEKFAQIAEVRDFVKELEDLEIRDFTFDTSEQAKPVDEQIDDFVDKFDLALQGKEEEDQKRVLEETKKLIDSVAGEGEILNNVDDDTKAKLKEEIESRYGGTESGTLAETIKDLLGLN